MKREEQRAQLIAEARQPWRKQISAMIRVKNEEEFLYASVCSILNMVDEVVLVDNLSSDSSPRIIRELQAQHPDKVRSYFYPHEILRVGKENWDYSRDPAKCDSPRLSANFYSWCLQRCTRPYVLKWDGDMIARLEFSMALEEWRQSGKPVLSICGLNVHPDRDHYIAPRCAEREPLLARLTVPGLPLWVTVLTRDSQEPRLFPHRFARYGPGKHWTQGLESPCTDREVKKDLQQTRKNGCYLHMKFCKHDSLANYSPDLAEVIASNIMPGPALDDEAISILDDYGVSNQRPGPQQMNRDPECPAKVLQA